MSDLHSLEQEADTKNAVKDRFHVEPPPLYVVTNPIRTLSLLSDPQQKFGRAVKIVRADPWALPDLQDHSIKFHELRLSGRIRRVLVIIVKLVLLILMLYNFVCSLELMSAAFKILTGKAVRKVTQSKELLKNPVVGLMIGVLVTVLVQSSSTSTSIVVTMIASSNILGVREAIPIVMGANIGTSVTNTMVSLVQAPSRNEFRRAFAAATVHDMFNWLTVFVLLPLEVTAGYLYWITDILVSIRDWEPEKGANTDFLKKLTNPVTKFIVKVDSRVIGNENDTRPVLQECCKRSKNETCTQRCTALLNRTRLNDEAAGSILLVISIILLCICLVLMVKVLNSMLKGGILTIVKKYINADCKAPWSVFAGYAAILVGCIMTILIQSSSIFTSALTPLAGVGVISLERVYPLTLGSNIGTTTTGILAALTADAKKLKESLQLAFCHLFFNITGVVLFYPLPFMRLPIVFAKALGNTTARYRWFSILYLVFTFFLLPITVFLLSLFGRWIFLAICIICIVFSSALEVTNVGLFAPLDALLGSLGWSHDFFGRDICLLPLLHSTRFRTWCFGRFEGGPKCK